MTDTSAPFVPDLSGRVMVIYSALNAGTFTPTYLSATQVRWTNAAGATESGHARNTWSVHSAYDYCADSLLVGNSNKVINSDSVGVTGFGHSVIDSDYVTVSGAGNEAFGAEHGVISGKRARSEWCLAKVHSGGPVIIGAPTGSGQMVEFPCSGQTTDGVATSLPMNGMVGDDKFFSTIIDHSYTFTVEITAKCGTGPSSTGSKGWILKFAANNVSGVVTILGSPVKEPLGNTVLANENSWDVSVEADGAFIKIKALGFTGETIWWQCSVHGAEVGMNVPS